MAILFQLFRINFYFILFYDNQELRDFLMKLVY